MNNVYHTTYWERLNNVLNYGLVYYGQKANVIYCRLSYSKQTLVTDQAVKAIVYAMYEKNKKKK